MNPTSRPLNEAVVELLREDPAFAAEHLAVALGEADEPGGQEAMLGPCATWPKRKAPQPKPLFPLQLPELAQEPPQDP